MEKWKCPPRHFPLMLNISMQQVPLKALDDSSRQIICSGLNRNIVKPISSGYARNFRGLAELTAFEYDEIQDISQAKNPTEELISRWQNKPGTTIGQLLDLLEIMERFDILDDVSPCLFSGGTKFLRFISEEEPPSPDADAIEALAKEMDLTFVSRPSWHARHPLRRTRLVVNPVRVIFVHHSVYLKSDLYDTVQSVQSCKIIYYGLDDLDYNFMVGHDGTVFEGRGWDTSGCHTPGYNHVALRVGLLGNYDEDIPSSEMLDAVLKWIEFGVQLGKIHSDHGIYPQCDESATLSPGRHTLSAISSWSRFRGLGPLPSPEQLRAMNECPEKAKNSSERSDREDKEQPKNHQNTNEFKASYFHMQANLTTL